MFDRVAVGVLVSESRRNIFDSQWDEICRQWPPQKSLMFEGRSTPKSRFQSEAFGSATAPSLCTIEHDLNRWYLLQPLNQDPSPSQSIPLCHTCHRWPGISRSGARVNAICRHPSMPLCWAARANYPGMTPCGRSSKISATISLTAKPVDSVTRSSKKRWT